MCRPGRRAVADASFGVRLPYVVVVTRIRGLRGQLQRWGWPEGVVTGMALLLLLLLLLFGGMSVFECEESS